MKIPRYWAKGSVADMHVRNPATGEIMENFGCWGWSDTSVAEAEERGKQRANNIAEMVRKGTRPDRYLYGDRPMREEIVEEWERDDGTPYAAITVNAYGCRILNTATVMFVDVDFPVISALHLLKHRLTRIWGDRGPSPRERQESDALAKVENMIKMDRQCGVRAYRTYAGLRYLITHAHAEPAAESTLRAMEALGADPLYVRLCKVQECFRASMKTTGFQRRIKRIS